MRQIQAESEKCWSERHVLRDGGSPVGSFKGKLFTEGVEIDLRGQQKLLFKKEGFFSRTFLLTDAAEQTTFGRAWPEGVFSRAWPIETGGGTYKFEPMGLFKNGYQVLQDGQAVVTVDRLGICERGWTLSDSTEQFDLAG
jgi:hypothetical protein